MKWRREGVFLKLYIARDLVCRICQVLIEWPPTTNKIKKKERKWLKLSPLFEVNSEFLKKMVHLKSFFALGTFQFLRSRSANLWSTKKRIYCVWGHQNKTTISFNRLTPILNEREKAINLRASKKRSLCHQILKLISF